MNRRVPALCERGSSMSTENCGDVPLHDCAPAGYYSPEWFVGGVSIGAGPWFHDPAEFHGHVKNHFDIHHGYKEPRPQPGEKAGEARRVDAAHFKGYEVRDGRGHAVEGKR